MPFLIDGYNVLRMIEKIYDESVTDVRMCQIVGRYLRKINDSGQMIFDGIGPPDKTGMYDIMNLEVIFTGANTDADTVIEEKIRINTAPRRLSIVSSDLRIRKAARTRKATDIRSDEFWSDVEKELGKKGGVKEPSQKRYGLTEGETDEWLGLFGLDQ